MIDEGARDQPANTTAAPRYNMRQRTNAGIGGFKQAIDAPHDSKSYYPPTQLAQLAASTASPKKKGTTFTFAHVLTQMSAKAGLRKHGQAAKASLMDEFAQLEDLSVYEPIDVSTLTTKTQRQTALRAINLIKEKGAENSRVVLTPTAGRSEICTTSRRRHLPPCPPTP